MGFFKDFKEDLSQAVNELSDDASKLAGTADSAKAQELPADDAMVNTLNEEETEVTDADLEASLSRMLAQSVEQEAAPEEAPSPKQSKKTAARSAAEERIEKEASVQASPEEAEEPEDEVSDETAIITPGLSIKGDINSAGSIELLGKVEGNVTCKGKLVVSGTIKGNSASADFFSDKADITGDITCNGPAKIGSGSVIIGNLVATSAVIAGAIKGDIDVQGPVIVDTTAIVMGNIKSKLVQINNGAVIEGYCSQCYSDNSPKKFFGEA
ncbi:MAG: polymer-forming cytoskeletal protein [Butyrivibrio sp.]|nr:polymer-forming cytoskeletal protein [Butyrivibrio sp.]